MKKSALIYLAVAALTAAAQVTDPRDGQTYRTVKIGKQTWMAQNLNIKSAKSKCYDNKESNCEKYGKLYNWDEAKKACPSGWHLPNSWEFNALVKYAGGSEVAEKKLKAKSGWKAGFNGTDQFGFSALPGGGYVDGSFYNVGKYGGWWSSSDNYQDAEYVYPFDIFAIRGDPDSGFDDSEDYLFSIRCVQDLVPFVPPPEWTASSTLASQGINSYFAANLQSTDHSVAWCEGVEGQGVGERVNAKIKTFANSKKTEDSAYIKSIVIMNGYAKDQATWKNNSRIKTLRFYVDGNYWSDLSLSDNIKPQTIQLPKSIPIEGRNQLDLSFEIAEVYPGSKFDDACITSIAIAAYAGTNIVDLRDGQSYRTVKIGKQTWMAQNLNFIIDKSTCYDEKDSNCEKYGRLYTWKAAIKACPAGWHLPDNNETQKLVDFAGGDEIAGKKLKAKSGWNKQEGNGTDNYGFSALPGGYSFSGPGFRGIGNYGGWWNSFSIGEVCDSNIEEACTFMHLRLHGWKSVRCLQD